jgi:hypothetical protein
MLTTPSRMIFPAIPPITSSVWMEYADLLHEHLSLPRTVDEIIEWAAKQTISKSWITNTLAWLSFRGEAKYDVASRRWMRGSDYA